MRVMFALLVVSAALASPGYLTSLELSHDNGNISTGSYVYLLGDDVFVGVEFDIPTGGPWYLNGIKYYVYASGWPDSIFQGYGVACWKMESGTPGTLVWPVDGNPIYNPNTGGYWIIQNVAPNFNLTSGCPDGFVVGIEFLYDYPTNDAFGTDNTGVGPYDWSKYKEQSWGPAPYGKGAARALINDVGNPGVETTTIGQIRALYR